MNIFKPILFRRDYHYFTGVSHIKLKKPQQLQEVLDVSRQLLEQIESGSSESELIEEKKSKLEQVLIWNESHREEGHLKKPPKSF